VNQLAEIAVSFDFAAGALVTFGDPLEVSLDCPVCRRCGRTVVFHEGQAEAKCTPTGHAFPGRIISKQPFHQRSTASVVYRIAYTYEHFTDA
jgi:hypothetical protein